MRISIILLSAVLSLVITRESQTQILINRTFIRSDNFVVENEYTFQTAGSGTKTVKDMAHSYFFYSDDTLIESSPYFFMYYNTTPNSGFIKIQFDTTFSEITSLSISNLSKNYHGPTDFENSGGYLSFTNAAFKFKRSHDTLSLNLAADELRSSNIDLTSYVEHGTRSAIETFNSAKMISISDSAYVSLTLIGTFPAAASVQSEKRYDAIRLRISAKTLILFGFPLKFTGPLACSDILGRKHNLEFLSADNESATYSVRSLRPGVYFVNDGRETVKFIIGE